VTPSSDTTSAFGPPNRIRWPETFQVALMRGAPAYSVRKTVCFWPNGLVAEIDTPPVTPPCVLKVAVVHSFPAGTVTVAGRCTTFGFDVVSVQPVSLAKRTA
jgi:hypothetical protein